VLTDEGRLLPNRAIPPLRHPFIILAVVLVVVGLGLLGFGLDLWVSHASVQACLQSYPPSRPSQAMLHYLLARCRSIGAWHNRGIVLTFCGVAAALLGSGTAVAVLMTLVRKRNPAHRAPTQR